MKCPLKLSSLTEVNVNETCQADQKVSEVYATSTHEQMSVQPCSFDKPYLLIFELTMHTCFKSIRAEPHVSQIEAAPSTGIGNRMSNDEQKTTHRFSANTEFSKLTLSGTGEK
jgi:hypothetical protein